MFISLIRKSVLYISLSFFFLNLPAEASLREKLNFALKEENSQEVKRLTNLLTAHELLILAIKKNDIKQANQYIDLIESLIKSPDDIHFADSVQGKTALHHIANVDGMSKILYRFLNLGALVNEKDYDGNTALHFAAQAGQIDNAALLITHGAMIEDENNAGLRPLKLAGRNGHFALGLLLLHRTQSYIAHAKEETAKAVSGPDTDSRDVSLLAKPCPRGSCALPFFAPTQSLDISQTPPHGLRFIPPSFNPTPSELPRVSWAFDFDDTLLRRSLGHILQSSDIDWGSVHSTETAKSLLIDADSEYLAAKPEIMNTFARALMDGHFVSIATNNTDLDFIRWFIKIHLLERGVPLSKIEQIPIILRDESIDIEDFRYVLAHGKCIHIFYLERFLTKFGPISSHVLVDDDLHNIAEATKIPDGCSFRPVESLPGEDHRSVSTLWSVRAFRPGSSHYDKEMEPIIDLQAYRDIDEHLNYLQIQQRESQKQAPEFLKAFSLPVRGSTGSGFFRLM